MSKRFVCFLALVVASSALLVLACSSQSPHAATLDCTLGCSMHGTGGSSVADGGDAAKPADDAAPDVVLDAGPQ